MIDGRGKERGVLFLLVTSDFNFEVMVPTESFERFASQHLLGTRHDTRGQSGSRPLCEYQVCRPRQVRHSGRVTLSRNGVGLGGWGGGSAVDFPVDESVSVDNGTPLLQR